LFFIGLNDLFYQRVAYYVNRVKDIFGGRVFSAQRTFNDFEVSVIDYSARTGKNIPVIKHNSDTIVQIYSKIGISKSQP